LSAIAERYAAMRRAVHDAADVAGRNPDEITIVAVTKHVGVGEVRQAMVAGCVDFGENRVQEFLGKYGLFPDVHWHFIGTLQTNKVKDVVGRARLIHSVDSLRLLEHIDRVAETHGIVQDVLFQVNLSAEASKHGMSAEEAEEALRASLELPAVNVRGLMTMAPLARPENVRWVFRDTARLFASLAAMRFNDVELCDLSMGMTNDYRVAIEEGATIIRVGQAIFGR
jgi:hypothetical protein